MSSPVRSHSVRGTAVRMYPYRLRWTYLCRELVSTDAREICAACYPRHAAPRSPDEVCVFRQPGDGRVDENQQVRPDMLAVRATSTFLLCSVVFFPPNLEPLQCEGLIIGN